MSMDKSAIDAIQAAQVVAEVTEQLAKVNTIQPLVATPETVNIQCLERFQAGRARPRGTMKSQNIGAFVAYSVVKAASAPVTTFVATEGMRAVSIFNLGTDKEPGHADDVAVLELPPTVEMAFLKDLQKKNDLSRGKLTQLGFAELVEEWRDYMGFYHDFDSIEDGKQSTLGQALAAIRKVDIKATREKSSTEAEFGRERSDLEKVAIESAHLPGFIHFKCVPYDGLKEHDFWIRVTVHLEGSAPQFSLRVIRLELEEQSMREELFELLHQQLVLNNIADEDVKIALYHGEYTAKN